MPFTLAATQAPHAGWFNGALAANARQYWLQPTQHTPNGPRIASAIAGMTPGEMRAIWTDVSGDLFRVRRADDGSLAAILDWTPRKAWSQATQQFLLGGRRGTVKMTAYSDVTGEWRELPMPAALGRNVNGTVHWYGCTAQDDLGRVYWGTTEAVSQTWRFDPATEAWTRLADTPLLSQLGSMFEWFGAAHGGAGGLVKYTAAKRLILLSQDGQSWTTLVNLMSNGQHAQVCYHPAHQRLLIVGGSDTLRGANLVTAAGAVQAVADAPDDVTMSGAAWVVAHPSGCWLLRCGVTNRRLYAGWPNNDYTNITWVDLGAAPDAAINNSTVYWDSVRDRIFITAEQGLYAYRPVDLVPPGVTGGGSSSLVRVASAGQGTGAEQAQGGAATLVRVTAVGAGQAQQPDAAQGGSSSLVRVVSAGAGSGQQESPAEGGSSSVTRVLAAGAGLALEIVVGGSSARAQVRSFGGGFGEGADPSSVTTPPSRRLRILADDRRLDIKR